MSKWVWIVFAILVSSGIYFTLRLGLKPKPIPVMNATVFEEPEQVGAALYRRLRQVVRAERLVVLGSHPDLVSSTAVWSGFVKAAKADGAPMALYFEEDTLARGPQVSGLERSSHGIAAFGEEKIGLRLRRNERVLVHGGLWETIPFFKEGLSQVLQKLYKQPLLFIGTAPLFLSREMLESAGYSCHPLTDVPPESDLEQRVECAVTKASRRSFRKRYSELNLVAAAEMHGLKHYLLFLHEPLVHHEPMDNTTKVTE